MQVPSALKLQYMIAYMVVFCGRGMTIWHGVITVSQTAHRLFGDKLGDVDLIRRS